MEELKQYLENRIKELEGRINENFSIEANYGTNCGIHELTLAFKEIERLEIKNKLYS